MLKAPVGLLLVTVLAAGSGAVAQDAATSAALAAETVCQTRPTGPDAWRPPLCIAYPGTDSLPRNQVAILELKGFTVQSLDGKPVTVCGESRGRFSRGRIWCHAAGSLELLPGRYALEFVVAFTGPQVLTVDVEAGKTYQVKCGKFYQTGPRTKEAECWVDLK